MQPTIKKKIFFLSHLTIWVYFWALCCRGPQSLGHRPVLIRSLFGTGPHSRRWAAGKWTKLHLPLPIAHITAWTVSPLIPWKKCFLWNSSLVSDHCSILFHWLICLSLYQYHTGVFVCSFCIYYHTVLMTDFVVSLEIRKYEFFSFILV